MPANKTMFTVLMLYIPKHYSIWVSVITDIAAFLLYAARGRQTGNVLVPEVTVLASCTVFHVTNFAKKLYSKLNTRRITHKPKLGSICTKNRQLCTYFMYMQEHCVRIFFF